MTQPLPPLMLRHRRKLIGYGQTPMFDLPAAGEWINIETGGAWTPYQVRLVEWHARAGVPYGSPTVVYTPGSVVVYLADGTHEPGPLPLAPRVDLWHNGSHLGRMVKTLEPKLGQVISLEDETGRARYRCSDVEWWFGDAGPGGVDTLAVVFQVLGKRCHLTLIADD